MPTIVIASDLHLGITSEEAIQAMVARIIAEQPDLTVLAGDIGEGITLFRRCLALFANVPGEIAVLAGNHDVWAYEQQASQDLWERLLPQATRDAGILWLEDASWQHDGVAVVGSLAWYDYSAADPELEPHPPEVFARRKSEVGYPDAKWINWPWSDVEFAERLGDGLYQRLVAVERDPAIREVVVVTHMPIFAGQILYKPGDVRWGFGNAYFGNLTLGQRVLESQKLRSVISGHTHIGKQGVMIFDGFSRAQSLNFSVVASDFHKPGYSTVKIPHEIQ